MHRRVFLLATGSGALFCSSPAAAVPCPPSSRAAARIGQRLAAALPAGELGRLRRIAASLPPVADAALAARVAADHRAGRTVSLQGVTLSRTEAAWCLGCARRRGGDPAA